MIVVGLSTFALIVSVSVFNGLESLLKNVYSSFDPDITIVPEKGKFFDQDEQLISLINSLDGVVSVTRVIQDNALLKYQDTERVVTIKGVSEDFWDQKPFEEALFYGEKKLKEEGVGYAILGRGIAYTLEVNIKDGFNPLQVYYPSAISTNAINPRQMFQQRNILAAAHFAIEKSYDNRLVFVPIEFMRDLTGNDKKLSALEVTVTKAVQIEALSTTIKNLAGAGFNVKTQSELHGDLYRILQIEKLFVFLVFGVIMIIGSVNIYFALSMIVIDKKKDMSLLHALGGQRGFIRTIFLYEGSLIAGVGALSGLALGLIFCWLQMTYALISLGVEGAITTAYPIAIEWVDIVLSVILILGVTWVAALHPARKAARSLSLQTLQ